METSLCVQKTCLLGVSLSLRYQSVTYTQTHTDTDTHTTYSYTNDGEIKEKSKRKEGEKSGMWESEYWALLNTQVFLKRDLTSVCNSSVGWQDPCVTLPTYFPFPHDTSPFPHMFWHLVETIFLMLLGHVNIKLKKQIHYCGEALGVPWRGMKPWIGRNKKHFAGSHKKLWWGNTVVLGLK